MTRRRLALLAAAAVLVSPVAAASAAPKARTLTFDYTLTTAGGVNSGGSFSLNACEIPGQCFDFETVKGEKLVKIEAADELGKPIGLQVWTEDDYAGTVALYCGTVNLKVNPKSAHQVSVRTTVVESCQSVPTQGVLTATITK